MAFKVKELQFRIHTWKRSREISRAYDDRPRLNIGLNIEFKPKIPKVPAAPKPPKIQKSAVSRVKPPAKPRVSAHKTDAVRFEISAAVPYAVKAAKALSIAAGLFLVVFGLAKAVPYVSTAISASASAKGIPDSADGGGEGGEFEPIPAPELPDDADLPEAAVLPEGYADHAPSAGGEHAHTQPEAAPQALVTAQSSRKLMEAFRAGMPRGLPEHLILVDKANKVMYLFRNGPDGWEIAREYPVATGEMEGPKRVEGDKKTPQGVYFIVGRKHRSELTNLYGPAAFILDYPNEDDRAARRTGHGIWIHGSERGDIPPLFTQGCVATSNPLILDLARFLRNGIGVPVIIVSGEEEAAAHFASVDFRRLQARGQEVVRNHAERQAEFEKIVLDWKTAWESKDIETYTSFYSTSTFANGTQRWDAYREHKLRTFAMYSTINIDLSDIALTELTSNSATVKFNQLYVTNVNRMENAKRLIFRKEQDSWKIYREIPFSKEELLL